MSELQGIRCLVEYLGPKIYPDPIKASFLAPSFARLKGDERKGARDQRDTTKRGVSDGGRWRVGREE